MQIVSALKDTVDDPHMWKNLQCVPPPSAPMKFATSSEFDFENLTNAIDSLEDMRDTIDQYFESDCPGNMLAK